MMQDVRYEQEEAYPRPPERKRAGLTEWILKQGWLKTPREVQYAYIAVILFCALVVLFLLFRSWGAQTYIPLPVPPAAR